MKQLENYFRAQVTPTVNNGETLVYQKAKAKLVDANTDQGLTNPSLMLWAMLGLSAEHSYILTPLS